MFGASGDPKTEFMKWFNEKPEQHANEIKFFFREKIRVQHFLMQKQKALVEKIASEKIGTDGKYADAEEVMQDEEWTKQNVYNDPRYESYKSGNIKNAYAVLTAE